MWSVYIALETKGAQSYHLPGLWILHIDIWYYGLDGDRHVSKASSYTEQHKTQMEA